MFTGIVEELGTVIALDHGTTGARLGIGCAAVLEDLREGGSIAVNGLCLTAVDVKLDSFAADLSPETLRRGNLGQLTPGARVNLERPVTPSTRLSGHIVQGHVDATGEVVSLEPLGEDHWSLKVRVPLELERYLVPKGSIAIDGISLTIASLEPGPIVGMTIIPHTYAHTTLGCSPAGARVNVEADVLAKHIERLMQVYVGGKP
jgi:riboflavin synthase